MSPEATDCGYSDDPHDVCVHYISEARRRASRDDLACSLIHVLRVKPPNNLRAFTRPAIRQLFTDIYQLSSLHFLPRICFPVTQS